MEVKGRDLVSGIPKTVRVHSQEIRECIQEPIQAIVEAVRRALEITPPELASDIVDRGIVMTGGGALIRGPDQLIARETNLPIHVDEEPLTLRGARRGRILDGHRNKRSVDLLSAFRPYLRGRRARPQARPAVPAGLLGDCALLWPSPPSGAATRDGRAVLLEHACCTRYCAGARRRRGRRRPLQPTRGPAARRARQPGRLSWWGNAMSAGDRELRSNCWASARG